MSTFFKIVRYFFAVIFIFLLLLLFFVGIPLTATTQTFVNRDNVKNVLDKSGIYDNFIDILVEQSETIETDSPNEIFTLIKEDPQFRLNLKALFSSDEIQPKIEIVIDALYDWLEGKVTYPQFEISLIEDEATFNELFLSITMLRLESLPICSTTTQEMPTDLSELECIPPGTNLNSLERAFKDALDSNEADMTETMDSFKFSSDQLNISYETSVLVQSIFRVVRILPILLAIVIVLITFIIILLIPSAKGAFILASVIYLLTGLLFVGVSSLKDISGIIQGGVSTYNVDIPYSQMQDLMTNLFTPVFEAILHNIFIYSLVLLGVGVIFLIIGIVIKKKVKEEVKVETITPNEEITTNKGQDTV